MGHDSPWKPITARRDAVFRGARAPCRRVPCGATHPCAAELFHHRALGQLFYVDGEQLVGLAAHAVDVLVHDARPGHRELVAFAADMFSSRMVRCSSPRPETMKVSVIGGVLHPQGDVALGLALEPLAQLPAGDEPALAPARGEALTRKFMVSVGSSTLSSGSASGCSGWHSVEPMLTSSTPVDQHDVAASASPPARARDLEAEHLVHSHLQGLGASP